MTSQAEIHDLIYSEDVNQRRKAAIFLKEKFGYQKDIKTAWEDLIRLAKDENGSVRSIAADAIRSAFTLVPDKDKAWMDLLSLAQDEDRGVRRSAAKTMGSVFSLVPDKDKAWVDLDMLAEDEYNGALLDSVFNQVYDNDEAWSKEDHRDLVWQDTHPLEAIIDVFRQYPDRADAWKYLQGLTQSEYWLTRSNAVDALRLLFYQIPDKDKAWMDLHKLAQDEDSGVRSSAAEALGSAFSLVPDKDQAWVDLHKLAQDEDSGVRCTSNHSLGRVSILRATESDDEFRTHLEEAIEFFRRSSEDAEYANPAAFCLPFYRSLHSILFTEMPREDEVQRYLAEAKEAIKGSESREVLLEAVNNLSMALQEVRNYSIDDIILRKQDLRSYTKYCLQTAECLREARDKTPLASKIIDYTLIEKSIPIVDKKIKALFKDVEAAAGRLCGSTKGTDLEAFGRDAYESTKGLNKVESWIAADQYLERIVPLLRRHCNRLPKEAQEHLKTLIDSQDISSLEQRLNTLESVLLASLVQGENDDLRVKELKGLLDLRLQGMEFAIINMKDSSGNARKELYSLKTQIDGLQREIESQGLGKKKLSESLEERDRATIDRLNKMRDDMIKAVRETARLNASKRDVDAILKEIDNQDRLKKRDVLGIIGDISSLVGLALAIL